MPERQKDDGLDGEKLQNWIVGRQQVSGGEVEEDERIQGQGDRDLEIRKDHAKTFWPQKTFRPYVVDESDVDVGRVSPISVLVNAIALEEDDDERHHRLHHAKLEGGLFAEPQESDVVGPAVEAARAVPEKHVVLGPCDI